MGAPSTTRRGVAPASKDLGYRLVSVSRLSEVCNPFVNPPWEDVASLTVEGVRQAMVDGLRQPQSYSARTRSCEPWTVVDHIARIAHLAVVGWAEPIEVDVGIPSMGCWVNWPVTDGNHRLAAAIVRGDQSILASVGGSCAYMRELFGRLSLPKALPSHAYSREP